MGVVRYGTKLMHIPEQAERAKACDAIEEKMATIRKIFKEIEAIADKNIIQVYWEGLDNQVEGEYSYGIDSIWYRGQGQWVSSARDDC